MSQFIEIRPEDGDGKKLSEHIAHACDLMECIYTEGHYPRLTVERSWSRHNPTITGEIARPSAFRWYLQRELTRLARKSAAIRISRSRPRIDLDDTSLLESIDENDWDITQKKLFLFAPERIDLSIERIEHYTGRMSKTFSATSC